MTWIINNWDNLIVGLLAVLGGFSQLAQLTPNKSDDALVQKALDFVNVLAGNNGKAKNAPDA